MAIDPAQFSLDGAQRDLAAEREARAASGRQKQQRRPKKQASKKESDKEGQKEENTVFLTTTVEEPLGKPGRNISFSEGEWGLGIFVI